MNNSEKTDKDLRPRCRTFTIFQNPDGVAMFTTERTGRLDMPRDDWENFEFQPLWVREMVSEELETLLIEEELPARLNADLTL